MNKHYSTLRDILKHFSLQDVCISNMLPQNNSFFVIYFSVWSSYYSWFKVIFKNMTNKSDLTE